MLLIKSIIIIFIIAGFSACGTSKVDDSCIAVHPIESSEDVRSDSQFIACAVPPTDIEAQSEPVECEGPTIEDIELECKQKGYPCDGTIQVSYNAAICIAERDGRLSGIDGPYAHLVYNSRWNRPIWGVSMAEEGSVGGIGNGTSLYIDAETGDVLEMLLWLSEP